MNALTVDLGDRSYPIHLIDGLPGPTVASEAARLRPSPAPVLVVTDDHVGPLYAGDVCRALEGQGHVPTCVTLPHGESTKCLESVGSVVDDALAAGLGRQDLIVALGGGVVGDVAGFAAAVLMRGVGFIQVPTTLLAQVDSAVGGKTGVNHAAGKNLIGAFWQPRAVVSSHAVLSTLPERERRCGLAEAVKYGFLGDADLVTWCEAHAGALVALEQAPTLALVERCCRMKADIVRLDERDTGQRAVLNLGHTFGHAYERLMGYGALTHGEAVALGMVWAARLSERLGVAQDGLTDAVVRVLGVLGLPADPESSTLPELSALCLAARTDKKSDQSHVAFVLMENIGKTLIQTLSWIQIEEALLGQPSWRTA